MATRIADLVVHVGGDTADADRSLESLDKRLSRAGQSMAIAGAGLTAGLTLPLVGLGKGALDTAMDYESAMNMMQANSGATAQEMALVATQAKALGADMTLPATSAADATLAMLELVKAGFSVQEAMQGARGVLQLSAAGNVENSRAALLAANAIQAFGVEASKASTVADLFSAAANKSSASVEGVGDAFQMAAAVWSSFQGPAVGAETAMIDLTASIGVLANMVIKGSDAGTSLKQAILQLTAPSKVARGLMKDLASAVGETGDIAYRADGSMRPFMETIDLVSRATADMTEEQRNFYISQIFGADATRAVVALMRSQGAEAVAAGKSYADMEAALMKGGAASELASSRMKGLKGAIEGFKSVTETVALELSERFLPALEGVVRGAAGLVAVVPNLPPQLLAFAGGVALVLAAAGPTLLVLGAMASALAFLVSPIGLIVAGLALLAGAFAADLGGARGHVLAFFDASSKVFSLLSGLISAFAASADRALRGDFKGALESVASTLSSQGPILVEQFASWGRAAVEWIARAVPPMLSEAARFTGELLSFIVSQIPAIASQVAFWAAEFIDWISEAAPPMLAAAGEFASSLLSWIAAQVPGIIDTIGAWTLAAINWVADATLRIVPLLLSFLGSVLDWVIQRAPDLLRTFLSEWVPAAIKWAAQAAIDVLPKLFDLLGIIAHWIVFEGAPRVLELAAQIGKALVDGIWQGIQNLGGWLGGKISAWIDQNVTQRVRSVLGAHSPSLVFEEIGQDVGEGFVLGIESSIPAIDASLGRIVGSVRSATGEVKTSVQEMQRALWDAASIASSGRRTWYNERGEPSFENDPSRIDWSQSGVIDTYSQYGVDPSFYPEDVRQQLYEHNINARAAGGPVGAGLPYLVGERGPELFVPEEAGFVVPLSPRPSSGLVPSSPGGGGGVSYTIVVTGNTILGSERETANRLMELVRPALLRTGQRNPDIFGGRA